MRTDVNGLAASATSAYHWKCVQPSVKPSPASKKTPSRKRDLVSDDVDSETPKKIKPEPETVEGADEDVDFVPDDYGGGAEGFDDSYGGGGGGFDDMDDDLEIVEEVINPTVTKQLSLDVSQEMRNAILETLVNENPNLHGNKLNLNILHSHPTPSNLLLIYLDI